MTVRTDRKIALVAGLLLAAFGSAGAALNFAGLTIGSATHTAHQVIPGPVKELRIEAGQGDVTILPADGTDITIDSRARGTLATPRLDVGIEGADVEVKGGCPGVTFWQCSAKIVVKVPRGTDVRVEAESGDVAATGMDGVVRLVTHSGDVVASGLSGQIHLRTSSGDVVARELSGSAELRSSSGDVFGSGLDGAGPVVAHTSSGDVLLRFAAVPSDVDASTSSGDAEIMVPRGGESYRVEVQTDSGDPEIGVRMDPDAERVLRARTSSGDAVVTYADD